MFSEKVILSFAVIHPNWVDNTKLAFELGFEADFHKFKGAGERRGASIWLLFLKICFRQVTGWVPLYRLLF